MHKDLPLFLFDIVMIATNGKFLLKRSYSHSHSSPLPLVVSSANSDGSASTFLRQFTKQRYLPMGLCDHNYVILRTNRARSALNMEILDLLNEESVSGARSGRASP